MFVDSEPETMNMDPDMLERAIVERYRITGRYPKAIIPVDLYGMPARLKEIIEIADSYGIPVLEDAAEALGSKFDGQMCGTFGAFGALSFNGNKIITTSGGGALVCHDQSTAGRVKFYATQAREDRPYYYHETIGYNYRLSNISAAIGCGQMDVLEQRINRRREIRDLYDALLTDCSEVTVQSNPDSRFQSNFWLTTIAIDSRSGKSPEMLRQYLAEDNIESRRLWRPMHMQPVFADAPYYGGNVSERLFDQGLCLPSGSSLRDSDIIRVAERIKEFFRQ